MGRSMVLAVLLASAGCPKGAEPTPDQPGPSAFARAIADASSAAADAGVAPALAPDAELAVDVGSPAQKPDAAALADAASTADTAPTADKADATPDIRAVDSRPERPRCESPTDLDKCGTCCAYPTRCQQLVTDRYRCTSECASGSDCPTGCCAGLTDTRPIGTCSEVSECVVAGQLAQGSYQVVVCRTSADSFAGGDGLYIVTQACPEDVGRGDVHARLTWDPDKRLVFDNQVVCRVLTIGFVPPAVRGNIPACL